MFAPLMIYFGKDDEIVWINANQIIGFTRKNKKTTIYTDSREFMVDEDLDEVMHILDEAEDERISRCFSIQERKQVIGY